MAHKEGAAHPSTSTTYKIQQAQEIVMANWRVIIDEVTCSLQITTLCSSFVHTASGAAMFTL